MLAWPICGSAGAACPMRGLACALYCSCPDATVEARFTHLRHCESVLRCKAVLSLSRDKVKKQWRRPLGCAAVVERAKLLYSSLFVFAKLSNFVAQTLTKGKKTNFLPPRLYSLIRRLDQRSSVHSPHLVKLPCKCIDSDVHPGGFRQSASISLDHIMP